MRTTVRPAAIGDPVTAPAQHDGQQRRVQPARQRRGERDADMGEVVP
jgi:hypothetical protein